MVLSEIRIKNFRCLADVEIPLNRMTVIIGENNAGKTALLEAIKIVLGRRWGSKGTGFAEYDFYVSESDGASQQDRNISVYLKLEENEPDEWPEDLVQSLNEIVQTDKHDIDSIRVTTECGFNDLSKVFEAEWNFLDRSDNKLIGGKRRATNAHPFFSFVPVFSLSALRDASSEFSSRSYLWKSLLKSINIPDSEWENIEKNLQELNESLLNADPKIREIRDKIQELSAIVSDSNAGHVDIRALPLKIWDLISRSEIFVKGKSHGPWLPIERHGQGVQSLAVVYLFQAFVEHLIHDTHHKLAEPILLLEEPEAHLHPQASRVLGTKLKELSGQKIVTTHSPFFLERVELRDIRILRNCSGGTKVFYLKEFFKVGLQYNQFLKNIIDNNASSLSYNNITSELILHGMLTDRLLNDLKACYAGDPNKAAIYEELENFYTKSQIYIEKSELISLQGWARRIRGEIFFSRVWLLCEGQTEYILYHTIFDLLDYSLDTHGISVIDYQNNGSPGAFTSLARALGFPWLMTCDGDQGGSGFKRQVCKRGFSQEEIEEYIFQLEENDIELYLLRNGFRNEIIEVGVSIGDQITTDSSCEEIYNCMKERKVEYTSKLSNYLKEHGKDETEIPDLFKNLKRKLISLSNE